MSVRFGLICATAVVTMGTSTGTAGAQIVTISSAGFVAGPPPKADPRGAWSVTAAGSWRVKFEYGTVSLGTFTLDNTIGLGGTVPFVTQAGGTGTWGPLGLETLKNPLPRGATVRAELQKETAPGTWAVQATAYELLN